MSIALRIAVVDDERLARNRLRRLLRAHPALEVVGEADSGPSAVRILLQEQPDLVFLDIDLPEFDGFEVLRRLDRPPLVIFTTAYDKYSLKAFETLSIDYLLKPVESTTLARAVAKLDRLSIEGHRDSVEARLQELVAQWQPQIPASPYLRRLTVKLGERAIVVDVDEITHFYSQRKYVLLHTLSGQSRAVSFTLSKLEQCLDPQQFVRIHRATLANINQIREIRTWFGGKYKIVLRDRRKTELVVSKTMARNLRALVPF